MWGNCPQKIWAFLQPTRFFEIVRGLLLSLFSAQFRSYCSLKLSKFRPILWIKIASGFKGLHLFVCFFFLRSLELSCISRGVKRLGISWIRYLEGLFGWYKPKFEFSELIWNSGHTDINACHQQIAENHHESTLNWTKLNKIGNEQTFSNTLWIYLQFCKAYSSYETRYFPILSRSK